MDFNDIFQDLFVLEMTNNHQGSLERGLRIVEKFSAVMRKYKVKAAIKIQLRNYDNFIHKEFNNREDIYYINKVNKTKLSDEEFSILVEAIRKSGCFPVATPFDNDSVDTCVRFDMPFIKVASSGCNDWTLLEKIASTGKPVIASIGGTPLEEVDEMVALFEAKKVPLAINHCICAYPHEDNECQLNQIDFLKNRYSGHVIGLSTHEYHDWVSSISIAYAKGARTFERHIDLDDDEFKPAKYSSLPHQIDTWLQAYHRAKIMCGDPLSEKIPALDREIQYLGSYMRGLFAKEDFSAGHVLSQNDTYLAIPLQKGQISTREFYPHKYSYRLTQSCRKDQAIFVDMVDAEHLRDEAKKASIRSRGL